MPAGTLCFNVKGQGTKINKMNAQWLAPSLCNWRIDWAIYYEGKTWWRDKGRTHNTCSYGNNGRSRGRGYAPAGSEICAELYNTSRNRKIDAACASITNWGSLLEKLKLTQTSSTPVRKKRFALALAREIASFNQISSLLRHWNMITRSNLFLKRVGQVTIVSVLTIPMIGLSEKQSSAIPLTPILDRVGRSIVEGVFNVDSTAQETPPTTQPAPDVQQETTSFPEFPLDRSASSSPTFPPVNPNYPHRASPAPPNYFPSTPYPQGYPTYPQYFVPTPPVYSVPMSPPAYWFIRQDARTHR